jgi:signal transduction histidine kinase
VKDNGRGIRQESLSRFEQTGAGMGVGLSGMRERVRELGGWMKVEAGAPGTSVHVAIPISAEGVATG